MPRSREHIRDFPGKRRINLILRSIHLIGIVLLGAALLGAGSLLPGACTVLLSGLGMFAIDLWANPNHLREVAGVGTLAKLALIGLAAAQPTLALVVFWTLIIVSTLLSHASGTLRHHRLF